MALRAKLLQSYTMRLHLLLYPTIDLFTNKKQSETKKLAEAKWDFWKNKLKQVTSISNRYDSSFSNFCLSATF